ncbi:MAG: glycoside hydrolase family 38 C-terminal domain-containing protein [Bacteroidota bacterium]
MRNFSIGLFLIICLHTFFLTYAKCQTNYFIDGYHGGIWGHYPPTYTTFIADNLDRHPFWKINLEIEPVTWDAAKLGDLEGYNRLKKYAADQSEKGRVEFVNPSYGQSYLFNVQGESVIKQFELGIRKIREHFPDASFTTYSSEEPCFTSALPQILKSFGYKYASLKNPNTCWGGYTSAHGGELVEWTGSDGSSLLTVPRYESESFKSNSTWQTIAWNNAPEYLKGARAQGIANPIGMCIQDAGWKNGPWLGQPKGFEYKLWKDYIGNTADKSKTPIWNFTQENVQVSLVWGAQILQQLAQRTRIAENKLIMAEKLHAIYSVNNNLPLKKDVFKSAWENLLLAQHHDSWIVPYNIVDKQRRLNWADQVKSWTDKANELGDSVLNTIMPGRAQLAGGSTKITVFNSLGYRRNEIVSVPIDFAETADLYVTDEANRKVASQLTIDSKGNKVLLLLATVPAMSSVSYQVKKSQVKLKALPKMSVVKRGVEYHIESDLYKIVIDASRGGTIKSLTAKVTGKFDYVNSVPNTFFNEMKGYFYRDTAYHSSADQEAKISIIEHGALSIKVQIQGFIAIHPFTQYLTLRKGDERIDFRTQIDWKGNPGIGEDYHQVKDWKQEQLKKAFYNDKFKLSAIFPLAISDQSVYKNAAFDVMKSRLNNTFFSRWDSIKNNIIVNWVDVANDAEKRGMAMFTDHTTSYQHGEDGLLGLTLQYSGRGLWGKNYTISGPSEFTYALLPHTGDWQKASLWAKSLAFNEPLQVIIHKGLSQRKSGASLISITDPNVEISAVQTDDSAIVFRLFNASSKAVNTNVTINSRSKKVIFMELNGTAVSEFAPNILNDDKTYLVTNIPAFGIRTLKITL